MKQNVFIVALAAVVFVVVSAGASWDRSMDQDRHRSAGKRGPGMSPCEGWPYTMSIFDETPQLLKAELCIQSFGGMKGVELDGPISIDINSEGDLESISLGYAYEFGPVGIISRPVSLFESESPGQLRQYVVLDYAEVFQIGFGDVTEVRPLGVIDVTGDGLLDLVVAVSVYDFDAGAWIWVHYYFENILTPPLAYCDEDVNEDGQVAVDDVLAVISAWGQNCL